MIRKTTIVIARFMKEYIICHFGIPKVFLSDNGTSFVNSEVSLLTDKYSIIHHRSTVAYRKCNGQAEATNKTLVNILAKMLEDFSSTWDDKIPEVLWAYQTTKMKPTGYTPFSLIFGTGAVSPVELEVPSARYDLQSAMLPHSRHVQLEALEENRDNAQRHFEIYWKQLSKSYDQLVRPRKFKEGDLVLKACTRHIRGLPLPKFEANWEGPYIV